MPYSRESPDPIEPIDGVDVISPKVDSQATARKFVSQNGTGYMAIGIVDGDNEPVDADPGTLRLQVWFSDGSTTDRVLIADVTDQTGIIRDDIGKYHYDIGTQYTSQRGQLDAEWTYGVNAVNFTFGDNMLILDQMPYYDQMTDDAKLIVEQSSWYFADLFDSTNGGPWLQENFQTHFNYERIGFLMGQAIMKFNVTGFPVTHYGVTKDDAAIPGNFQPLTIWATKLEIIRHLILSYTEQPEFRNMATTYTDRRDYPTRWLAVLEEEKPLYTQAVKMAKRELLNLGRGSLLLSGGIFGGTARSFFFPGIYAAQTRAFRFYPAAPAVMWPAQAFGR